MKYLSMGALCCAILAAMGYWIVVLGNHPSEIGCIEQPLCRLPLPDDFDPTRLTEQICSCRGAEAIELADIFSMSHSVRFVSHAGVFHGTDSDLQFTLFNDGVIVIEHFEDYVFSCVGTFALDETADGKTLLRIAIEENAECWFNMPLVLCRDADGLLNAFPIEQCPISIGRGPFWPMRQVDAPGSIDPQ